MSNISPRRFVEAVADAFTGNARGQTESFLNPARSILLRLNGAWRRYVLEKPVIALRGAELVNLVNSRDFRSRLAEAARRTVSTNREAGFQYYQDIDNKDELWSPVIEGYVHEIPHEFFTDWMIDNLRDDSNGNCHELLSLHIHTYPASGLALSSEDVELTCSPACDEYDVRPVIMVGALDPTNMTRGHLLSMQRTDREPYPYATEVLHEAWKRVVAVEKDWPSSRVADALEVPGYLKAAVVPFYTTPQSDLADIVLTDAFRRLAQHGNL